MNAVLETASRIVAKCDQTLVWATKFFPKDRPENEFGQPNLERGYRMFSAYLRSISEINIFKTDQRTSGNNIVFSPKKAAIILTGSLQFSATCHLILFSKRTFSRTRLILQKSIRMYQDETKWNEMSRAFDFTIKDRWVSDRSINHQVSEWLSEWMSEWVDVGEWVSGCDWLIQWVSGWVLESE